MWFGISFLMSAARHCKEERVAKFLHLLAFKTCSATYHIAWGGMMRAQAIYPVILWEGFGLGA